jgi:hypothetical protein
MCYDISFTVKLKELPAYFPDLETDIQLELEFEGTHIMGHSFNEHPILYRNRETNKLSVRPMGGGLSHFMLRMKNFFASAGVHA